MRRAILTTVSVLALGLGGAGLSYAQGDMSSTSRSGGPAAPTLSGTGQSGTAGGSALPSGVGTPQSGHTGRTTPQSGYTGSTSPQSSMPTMSGTSQWSPGGQMGMRGEITEAQQKLQRDNLYHGKIDGRLGRETKQALRQFQKQNGLRVTASLDRETRDALLGNGSMGQGSTTAPKPTPSPSGTSR
jgi:Putative peptidoglycan binding domain